MKKIILPFSFLVSACVFAGDLAVAEFSVDGGGGASSGGRFTITGTVGQPEAEPMSGGSFVVQGGSWSAFSVVETPGAPQVSVVLNGASVVLSWPAGGGEFRLQSNSDLNVPNGWINVSQNPATSNGITSVTLPVAPGKAFFRLAN